MIVTRNQVIMTRIMTCGLAWILKPKGGYMVNNNSLAIFSIIVTAILSKVGLLWLLVHCFLLLPMCFVFMCLVLIW